MTEKWLQILSMKKNRHTISIKASVKTNVFKKIIFADSSNLIKNLQKIDIQ